MSNEADIKKLENYQSQLKEAGEQVGRVQKFAEGQVQSAVKSKWQQVEEGTAKDDTEKLPVLNTQKGSPVAAAKDAADKLDKVSAVIDTVITNKSEKLNINTFKP